MFTSRMVVHYDKPQQVNIWANHGTIFQNQFLTKSNFIQTTICQFVAQLRVKIFTKFEHSLGYKLSSNFEVSVKG